MATKPNPRDVLMAARASQQRAEVGESKTQTVENVVSGKQQTQLNNSNTQLVNKSNTQSLEIPKYAQLQPVNLRLREDQLTALAELERVVMRRRKQKGGERITKNTLIRVAVDYLIANADKLEGDTEEEILNLFKKGMD